MSTLGPHAVPKCTAGSQPPVPLGAPQRVQREMSTDVPERRPRSIATQQWWSLRRSPQGYGRQPAPCTQGSPEAYEAGHVTPLYREAKILRPKILLHNQHSCCGPKNCVLVCSPQLKLVKAFPELLAAGVEGRLRPNVEVLQKQWRLQVRRRLPCCAVVVGAVAAAGEYRGTRNVLYKAEPNKA